MSAYDIYGANSSMATVQSKIEVRLGITMQERESSYFGVYCIWKSKNGESIEIKNNLDPIDNSALMDEYSNYSILIFANNTNQSKNIENTLGDAGFILLDHNSGS